SQSQCNNTYGSGVVTVVGGIQEWTVPYTGTYRIEAAGASAHMRQGGSGAKMRGDFQLTAGQVIKILVGQNPQPFDGNNGSGAGGTFVIQSPYNTNASILVIAGGGGGGHNGGNQPNANGSTSNSGNPGTSGAAGGTNGNGGG